MTRTRRGTRVSIPLVCSPLAEEASCSACPGVWLRCIIIPSCSSALALSLRVIELKTPQFLYRTILSQIIAS